VASFLPQCLQALSSGCSRLQKPHTMRVAHTATNTQEQQPNGAAKSTVL
jgi:murein L,D-transpeptidase YcbB/YkuD